MHNSGIVVGVVLREQEPARERNAFIATPLGFVIAKDLSFAPNEKVVVIGPCFRRDDGSIRFRDPNDDTVMTGLVPAIHVLDRCNEQDVDIRHI